MRRRVSGIRGQAGVSTLAPIDDPGGPLQGAGRTLTPDLPACRLANSSSIELPSGATTPSPVTATRAVIVTRPYLPWYRPRRSDFPAAHLCTLRHPQASPASAARRP